MDQEREPGGIGRRGFFGTLGAGVLGTTALDAAPPPHEAADGAARVGVSAVINGRTHHIQVDPRWTLLYVLRDQLGFTGTKEGCERGECGACTVLIDGIPRYACQTLAAEVEGREITTIEGLSGGGKLGPVQRALVEEDGLQCGYCTPGQVLAAEGLLRRTPDPTPGEIREAMSGNLCRCGAYDHIYRSVQRAAVLRRSGDAK